MTEQPFTVADYLLTRLKQPNVTEVFQIPGDYVNHFAQALEHFPGVNALVESMVRDIRHKTRKKYSAEEKLRIMLEGLRGEASIAELC